jgi:hypothetical protein
MFIGCTGSNPDGKEERQSIKYENLDKKTRRKISKTIAAFARALLDPKHELVSFFSVSDGLFHFIVHLLILWMLIIAVLKYSGGETLLSFVVAVVASAVLLAFIFDSVHLGCRMKWAIFARDMRREYILSDLEKGEGNFKSSFDWWSEELSNNAFEELELPMGLYFGHSIIQKESRETETSDCGPVCK